LCSADAPTTAVTVDVVEVSREHHSAHFLPPSPTFEVVGQSGEAFSTIGPHGPPVRFAGLRAHAYLRVWLI
jgi:hypothetical protein